jgi:hypothetical protein
MAIQTTESLSFVDGIYEGIIDIQSNADTIGGENFNNNTQKRNFQITNNIYSLDGIGLHPESLEVTSQISTTSFTDASDGLVCATIYKFINRDTINSVRVYISAQSQANAELLLYIIDSTNYINGNFGDALSTSDLYVVTESDLNNGYIEIPVIGSDWPGDGTQSLPIEPGTYYAAVEMYSLGGEYNIGIIDDLTVGQPAWSSSIWIPQSQAYTNGNALAIRLNLGFEESTVSIKENINDFILYPNPSNGDINISFKDSKERDIIIRNINGNIIYSKSSNFSTILDLGKYSTGIYLIEISTESVNLTKKLTIH